MITCRELIDFLMDYTSGELPAAQRAEFERHLAVCPPCVNYLRTYEESVRLGKSAFADLDRPTPESVPEDLVRAILNSRDTAH